MIPCHGQSTNPPRAYRRDPVPDHAPRTQPFVHVTPAPSSTLNETLPETDPPVKPRNPPRKPVPTNLRGPTKPPVVCPDNCDDQNPCSVDICSITEGGCLHTPKVCPAKQSCDVLDTGNCKAADAVVPCIAVVDDARENFYETLWNMFRKQYPSRPFCLLQPVIPDPGNRILYLPTAFKAELGTSKTIYDKVNRDSGNVTAASDWFTICKLDSIAGPYTSIKYVGLFVDQSGSMTTATVNASLELFRQKVADEGLTIKTVASTMMKENWITPFMTTLVP